MVPNPFVVGASVFVIDQRGPRFQRIAIVQGENVVFHSESGEGKAI